MGRMANILFIVSGLAIVFYLFGLMPENSLVSALLDYRTLLSSSFWLNIEGAILAGATALGIGIAVFGKNVELAAMVTIAGIILKLLADFIDVFLVLYRLNPPMALIIFSPIMMMIAVTGVDWWRGRDG